VVVVLVVVVVVVVAATTAAVAARALVVIVVVVIVIGIVIFASCTAAKIKQCIYIGARILFYKRRTAVTISTHILRIGNLKPNSTVGGLDRDL
jgi:hypothetical protein